MSRKEYFREPTLAAIIRTSDPVYVGRPYRLVESVMGLEDGEHLVITSMLVQSHHTPRSFLKHGQMVELATPGSIDEAVDNHMTPWILRKEAFDDIDHIYNAGYSFRPFADFQHDKRERRVRLVELCDALRILCYGLQTGNDIQIKKAYADSKRVSKDGATVAVSVPSRSQEQPRYDFNMYSVIVDSNDPNSYAVANGFRTDINIPVRRWSFRYNFYSDKEDSNVINIFAPEIAAYFRFMMEEFRKTPQNKSVADMSPFGLPTNLTVDFYKRLLSKVVIYDPNLKDKPKCRKLNKAEQEVMLWTLVKEKGYDKTFYRRAIKRDGPVENLDWVLLKAA